MTITSDNQLALYNGALRVCKSRKLASLTENRESCNLLNDVWADNIVGAALEEGLWTFAIPSVSISNDPSYRADFGYAYRFSQPSDFVRTAQVCVDEYFETPLTRYTEEGGYWFADINTLFIKYVSNSSTFGTNYNIWPPSFLHYMHCLMASRIIAKLSGAGETEEAVQQKLKMASRDAKSKTAMEEPSKSPPLGMFARARYGQFSADVLGEPSDGLRTQGYIRL